MSKQQAVRLERQNPAVETGLENELATIVDCAIAELHTTIESCVYILRKNPGRSQNLQRSTEHMVNIFHVCTNPADGNNYHKGNNQYISVFVNQVHHTTIEYRNQYLRMYSTALDLQYVKLQYAKLQYQYLKYQNIKYTISHISISHIQISYIQNTGIGGGGF